MIINAVFAVGFFFSGVLFAISVVRLIVVIFGSEEEDEKGGAK